jgi:hypothetical protein
MSYQLQRPGTKVSYSYDFGGDLDAAGSPSDTIVSANWTIAPTTSDSPTEPVLSQQSVDSSGRIATVLVENPHRGEVYALTVEIITEQGLRDRRTITIRCGP